MVVDVATAEGGRDRLECVIKTLTDRSELTMADCWVGLPSVDDAHVSILMGPRLLPPAPPENAGCRWCRA